MFVLVTETGGRRGNPHRPGGEHKKPCERLSRYVPFDCSYLIAIIIACFCKTAQVMKTYCGQDAMSRETLDGSGAPRAGLGPG